MAIVNNIGRRLFVQATSPWTATAATLATADQLPYIDYSPDSDSRPITSRIKAGTLGQFPVRRGRRESRFQLVVPVVGSATAGTRSDIDQVISAIFGDAGTVSAGVSVSYALTSTNIGLTIGEFVDPAGTNIWNSILCGGLITDWEVSFGEEQEAELSVSGVATDVIDKPNFSSRTTAEKRGLSSFPAEPSAASFLGVPALAFLGSVTINSVSTFQVERGRIYGSCGRALRSAFNSYYPTVPLNSPRTIGFDFSLYEEDTSAQASLRELARTKGTFDATVVLGDTAGNIWTWALNNIAINAPGVNRSGVESILSFTGTASISSNSANDELTLVCT